ncbi:MAG: site-specific DNA-methyltransferase, partial [Planctomyces sp.]
MPPANTAITDSKFNALKAKLRELFELDKSDLDFGIYRIIAAKNKEVTEFLDRQLKDVVKATLAAHGAGATDQVQAELDKAIDQARTLGADPEALPKVKELRSRLESAGGAAAAELEADIYNHLLAFFGRYYDEGDFISQRRYKGDTYAIPYSGEEVTLHWANKDQYYIKSGEWHK